MKLHCIQSPKTAFPICKASNGQFLKAHLRLCSMNIQNFYAQSNSISCFSFNYTESSENMTYSSLKTFPPSPSNNPTIHNIFHFALCYFPCQKAHYNTHTRFPFSTKSFKKFYFIPVFTGQLSWAQNNKTVLDINVAETAN